MARVWALKELSRRTGADSQRGLLSKMSGSDERGKVTEEKRDGEVQDTGRKSRCLTNYIKYKTNNKKCPQIPIIS